MMVPTEHLADFLGSEKRRRWDNFHRTTHMQCWKCVFLIEELAEDYGLHWNEDTARFKEETECPQTR